MYHKPDVWEINILYYDGNLCNSFLVFNFRVDAFPGNMENKEKSGVLFKVVRLFEKVVEAMSIFYWHFQLTQSVFQLRSISRHTCREFLR